MIGKTKQAGTVEIFSDGACRGNPGPGGWGVVLRYGGHEKCLYGGEKKTTNNRMELTAVIEGIAVITRPSHIAVTTDSQYVQRGVSEWLPKWKKNDWRTSNKGLVKNKDLWEKLDKLIISHDISWHWVKGHSGHRENEIADQLANRGIDEL